jgi:hypothetical protein
MYITRESQKFIDTLLNLLHRSVIFGNLLIYISLNNFIFVKSWDLNTLILPVKEHLIHC